jgi:3-oxo-5-alpha-steroid 4-dehydrogenase
MMMKNAILSVLCCFDWISVPGYCAMTLMVYLSYGMPLLQALASHGKTRRRSRIVVTVPATSSGGQPIGPTTTIRAFLDSEFFWIRKRRFSQFYYVGIAWLTLYVWLAQKDISSKNNVLVIAHPSIAILYLHLLRRLYECLWVHKWSESSRMHIAGYAVGLIHYLWLPSVFITIPCHDTLSSIFGSILPEPFFDGYDVDSLPRRTSESRHRFWIRLPAVIFCIWAQFQQHRHHVYLAELRQQGGEASNKEKIESAYTLPTKGWFTVITCPHYLAEILVYAGFALMLAQEGKTGPRHWIVLAWVASNLTLSAIMNHAWYKKNLPGPATEGKAAIIPYLI